MMRMRELASIEVKAVTTELQSLVGSYLKKLYEVGDGSFKLVFASKDTNALVYIGFFRAINMTKFSEEVDAPTNFIIAMRKRILGSKLSGVAQKEPDRIVVFTLESKDGQYRLVVELFGKGNLLLLKPDNSIALAYKPVSQKERSFRPGAEYRFPEASSITFTGSSEGSIEEALSAASKEETKLIKALLKHVDVGPIYAEDILSRLGLDPNGAAAVLKGREAELAKHLHKLMHESYSPRLYMNGEEIVDYALRDIKKYEGMESTPFKTLSEAIDAFYLAERSKPKPKENKAAMAAAELKASIEKQRKLLQEFKADEELSNKAGHEILTKMHEVNGFLGIVRESKKPEAQDITRRTGRKVKGIDLKEKTITLEL